jgi:PAS domain S-box-containing protein
MTASDQLAFLRDPRISAHATSALPAWLWADGATEILWANPTGAAIFDASTPAALAGRHFGAGHPAAQQIARLGGSLPQGGTPRLERLRGFGAGVGRMLVCSCARIALADGRSAILVAAGEPAGPSLPLAERVRRLFAGPEEPTTVFSRDGDLLYAGGEARQHLGDATTLAAAGAEALAVEALANGHAAGDTTLGALTLERIGSGNATVLLATFASPEATAAPDRELEAPAIADHHSPLGEEAAPLPDEPMGEEATPLSGEAPIAQGESAAPPPIGEPEPPTTPSPEEAATGAAPDIILGSTIESPPATDESPPATEPTTPLPHVVEAESATPAAAVAPPVEAQHIETQHIEPSSIEIPLVDASPADAPSAAEPPAPPQAAPFPERRHPLRFVWQTDADGQFTVGSEDFMDLLGAGVAALVGRPWGEMAAALALDPEGRVARALGSRDTWSGITVEWPVDGTPERLTAELSGLPMFGRDRDFRGYRGFGVCRDIAGMNAIMAARRAPPVAPAETPPASAAAIETQPMPVEISVAPVDVAPEHADETHLPDADIGPSPPPEEAAPSPPEPASHEPAPSDAPAVAGSDAPAVAGSEEPPAPEPRPQLTLVPPAKNIVPFRSATASPADRRPMLTPVERTAFQEIAKALGARVEGAEPDPDTGAEPAAAGRETPAPPPAAEATAVPAEHPAEEFPMRHPVPSAYASGAELPSIAAVVGKSERAVLDRVPVAVLVYRGERLLYANSTLLDWTGYEDLDAIAAAGGAERLFAEPIGTSFGEPGGSGKTFALTTRRGEQLPVEGRMFSVTWAGETALLTVLTSDAAQERARAAEQALQATEERLAASEQAIEDIEERIDGAEKALRTAEERLKISELSLRAAEAATREMESVLDTATDGVVVVNRDGVILASNRSAEALFGYESRELANRAFVDLFAPESHRAAHDYLTGLTRPGVASVLNDGREVIGRVAQGGLIPLFMTIGRIADGTDKFCAVFRDITQWKRAEEDLTNAKREAEKASSAKSDFLAKVSHEIRTPLNAIIGFSEVMMEERFGAVGNDRYRQYLKDIHTSGEHVISLVNDLLDLSKIEAGKLELNFARVELNDVVAQCVAIMQPQANRERIIIRTSLSPTLPPVVADERSVRQIVLNLLSNSIKFTGAGGQVIVSTALTDHGEEVLRVRDTGVGMTEKELSTALEPFRQVATAGRTGPGTGLGLPLTKALAEANRASFTIKSAVDAGTLVEIAFPANRVLAE